MKYKHVIQGKDFNRLSAAEVSSIKTECGKIAQHGIRYIGENTVVLVTNNTEDMNDVWLRNNMRWAHSTRPSRVTAGWKVIVVPNGHLIRHQSSTIFGIRFIATGSPTQHDAGSLTWTSEK